MKKDYPLGEHLTIKNGKLDLAQSKEKLLKLAHKEIKEWNKFIK